MKSKGALRTLSLAAASILAIMAGTDEAYAQEGSPAGREAALLRFDIPAQPLQSALMEFGRQARTTVVAPNALIRGRQSSAVQGQMSAETALAQMLAGTGLRLERTAEGGLGVVADAASPTRLGAAEAAPSEDEEVVVTGTNIRGLRNPTAPTQTFTREDIDNSGYATTQDFVRSLPANFQGGTSGASEDGVLGSGVTARANQEAASGVNLRGLGTSSTLVLLNGRRMAPAAFGGITDISIIPLAAIDRIDVVTDGSSAIYGGDAVAGVVNFIMRRDFQGSETRLSYGGVTDGSLRTTIASQTLGVNWQRGGLVATAQVQDRTPLLSSERDFTADTPEPTDLNPHTTKYSILFAGHNQITPELELFGDVLVTVQDFERLLTQGPTSQRAIDNTSLYESYNLGLGYDAFADWRIELRGNYGSQRTDFSYDYVVPAIVGYTPGTTAQRNRAEVTSFELNADGALFDLPGGRVRAAIGGGWREESFLSDTLYLPASSPTRLRATEREVSSAYAELYVPLIGEANALAFARRLDLSLAARWDDYSDFGETTNPKVGLIWRPFEGLDIRGSWSTSFRAPISNELMNPGTTFFNYQQPAPGGGVARAFVIGGTDPDLGPEESESWTLGFDYRPPALEGLLVSVNYYDIHFTDRILLPSFPTTILSEAATFGSIITPLADDAAAAAFQADLVGDGATFINLFGFGSTGVRYAVDLRYQNASALDQSGYDFSALYDFETGGDHVYAGLSASVIYEIITRLTETSTPGDILGTYGNPTSLRLRATLGWSRDGWRANAAVNYRGEYDDTSASPVGSVDPWTTADFNVGYRFGEESLPGLIGVSLELNITNLFDEPPPYVEGIGAFQPNLHYDVANADPYGRIVSLEIRKRW